MHGLTDLKISRTVLMKNEFSRLIFGKYSNEVFLKHSCGGSCTRIDGKDPTKLIVDFRNFANEPENRMKEYIGQTFLETYKSILRKNICSCQY